MAQPNFSRSLLQSEPNRGDGGFFPGFTSASLQALEDLRSEGAVDSDNPGRISPRNLFSETENGCVVSAILKEVVRYLAVS